MKMTRVVSPENVPIHLNINLQFHINHNFRIYTQNIKLATGDIVFVRFCKIIVRLFNLGIESATVKMAS